MDLEPHHSLNGFSFPILQTASEQSIVSGKTPPSPCVELANGLERGDWRLPWKDPVLRSEGLFFSYFWRSWLAPLPGPAVCRWVNTAWRPAALAKEGLAGSVEGRCCCVYECMVVVVWGLGHLVAVAAGEGGGGGGGGGR